MSTFSFTYLNVTTLYLVKIYFTKGAVSSHMVYGKDLKKLIKATYQFYINPGVNPHDSRTKPDSVDRITYSEMLSSGDADLSRLGGNSYWWSTPGLASNSDPNGAAIMFWEDPATVSKKSRDSIKWGLEHYIWIDDGGLDDDFFADDTTPSEQEIVPDDVSRESGPVASESFVKLGSSPEKPCQRCLDPTSPYCPEHDVSKPLF